MSVRSMEPSGAQVLDRLLRAKARSVVASMERFKDLLRQAAEGQIHVALGFASWPAYIADVVSTEMGTLTVEDCRAVVAVLGDMGMSTRAIGSALGVSNATVSRDEQVLHDVTPSAAPTLTVVTGLDGKTYPKPPPKPDVPKPPPKPPPKPEPKPPAPRAKPDDWIRDMADGVVDLVTKALLGDKTPFRYDDGIWVWLPRDSRRRPPIAFPGGRYVWTPDADD